MSRHRPEEERGVAMGVRTSKRVNLNAKPLPVPSIPIDIHDGDYRGKHPDDIAYPHSVYFQDNAHPQLQVELRAFSRARLRELEGLASDYLFPLMAEHGLRVDALAEKRGGGSKSGSRTLGACFARTGGDGKQHYAIILDKPDAGSSRVIYTLTHEASHCEEMNHGPDFKRVFGEFLTWGIKENTDFGLHREDLIGFAKGDTYAPPVAPSGDWDSYAVGARSEVPTVNLDPAKPFEMGLEDYLPGIGEVQ